MVGAASARGTTAGFASAPSTNVAATTMRGHRLDQPTFVNLSRYWSSVTTLPEANPPGESCEPGPQRRTRVGGKTKGGPSLV